MKERKTKIKTIRNVEDVNSIEIHYINTLRKIDIFMDNYKKQIDESVKKIRKQLIEINAKEELKYTFYVSDITRDIENSQQCLLCTLVIFYENVEKTTELEPIYNFIKNICIIITENKNRKNENDKLLNYRDIIQNMGYEMLSKMEKMKIME